MVLGSCWMLASKRMDPIILSIISSTVQFKGNSFIPYIQGMKWLMRLMVLLLAGVALLLFLSLAALMLILSCLRWLVTGRKPDFVVMVNAVQRYKDLAARPASKSYLDGNVIEAEVREVRDKHPRLPD